jgi:hypothetical protein
VRKSIVNTVSFSLGLALALAAPQAMSGSAVLGASCDLARAGGGRARDFLAFDRELRGALSRQDAAAMAFLVHFPLHLNHPEGYSTSLDDPAALQALFAQAFPPEVRSAVLNQKPDSIKCDANGIAYGNGEVWVTPLGKDRELRYKVKAVSLPGANREASEQRAPRIVFVCDAEKHHVILDSVDNRTARYRAWNKPRAVTDKPDLELPSGKISWQGTNVCTYAIWQFAKGSTEYVVNSLGCTDGSEPAGAIGNLEVSEGGKLKQKWWCY